MEIVQQPFGIRAKRFSTAASLCNQAMGVNKSTAVFFEAAQKRLTGNNGNNCGFSRNLAGMGFQMLHAEEFGADRFISTKIEQGAISRCRRRLRFCVGSGHPSILSSLLANASGFGKRSAIRIAAGRSSN